ncbi:uncharacterized protein LOC124252714 [Haliotis rubra]|uniref:uncharacterized protein LOC124252714 n=1 Tax=Haliotis rubra TaxID=36100 RepID=UPI001EE62278|nr:uncharacterized protein LOC124252714 [Haliotis rubra]
MEAMSTNSKSGVFSFGEFIMRNSKRATRTHNGRKCKRNVIICSKEKMSAAQELSKRFGQEGGQYDVIKCIDREMFDKERLPFSSFSTMYLLVDTAVASIFLRKGRLHNSVYDYFEGLEASGKQVLVVNKFEEKNRMFNEVLYQLPGDCTKEMKDITITSVPRHKLESEAEPSLDSDEDTQTEDEGQSASLEEAISEGMKETHQDDELINCQIGTGCTMNIKKSSHQLVIAKQDGTENTVNVRVVPGPTASKVVLVITTDPNNPELEKLLVHDIDAKKHVINIRLRSSDAQIVTVREGSVVIEIDVDPGQTMEYQWLESVVKDVFAGDLESLIPEGTTLNIDVQSSLVVPVKSLGKLGDFVLDNQEDLHKNCVASRKYEEKVKEVESLNKALLREKTLRKKRMPTLDMKTDISADILETVLQEVISNGVKSESGDFDPVDFGVSCVELIGQLSGEKLWDYVIMHPWYFDADGPFYNQMKRDVGLEHEKHCILPSFPDKIFVYNGKSDSLELCVDPHGHFPINPGIADTLQMQKVTTGVEKLGVGEMELKGMDVRPKVYRKKPNVHGTSGTSLSKTRIGTGASLAVHGSFDIV